MNPSRHLYRLEVSNGWLALGPLHHAGRGVSSAFIPSTVMDDLVPFTLAETEFFISVGGR
jgi:hypothetical protein